MDAEESELADSVNTLSGIYQIRNTITGGRYIGQSSNMPKRIRQESAKLRYGKHHNNHLQRSWNKHGAEAFIFEPLAVIQPALLTLFEQRAFDLLNQRYGCYNQGPFLDNAQRGKKRDAEHCRKLSEAHMGKTLSVEHRRNLSKAHTGNKSHLGRQFSAEHRRKLSMALMGNRRTRGRRLTVEHRRKISEGLLGHAVTAECRDKLIERNHCRIWSAESRHKISLAHAGNKYRLGKTHSAETRRKISEAHRAIAQGPQ